MRVPLLHRLLYDDSRREGFQARFWYHSDEFDSMPETPNMGYYHEAWGIHSPGFDHSFFVEKTRGKIRHSSDPRLRPTHANYKVKIESYPLGINWEFNFHPRRVSWEFGYAWIEDHDGQKRRVHSDAGWFPDTSTTWMDQRRNYERNRLAAQPWVRLDTATETNTRQFAQSIPDHIIARNLVPYGPEDGLESDVPGVYLKAWQPANNQVRSLILQVLSKGDDTVIRSYALAMLYEPRFGIDAGDAHGFDILTRTVENEMLQESWRQKRPPCPVCHEPLWSPHHHNGITVAAEETPQDAPVPDGEPGATFDHDPNAS